MKIVKDFELFQTKKKLIEAYYIALMGIELLNKKPIPFDDICCEYDDKFNGCCKNCPLWFDSNNYNYDCFSPNSFFQKYKLALENNRWNAAKIYIKEIYKQILQIKAKELPPKRINKSE